MGVKIQLLLVGLVGVIGLSGCRMDVSTEIYSQDVFSDETLPLPAMLEVEITSCDPSSRAEAEAEILPIFSNASEASAIGCRDDSFTSLLQVAFKAEISSQDSMSDLVVFRRVTDGEVELIPSINRSFRQRIDNLMSSNMQTLSHSDLTIYVTLHNDLPGQLGYYIPAGWVDGEPGQYIQGSLDRREKIRVQTPDVISALTLDNKQPTIMFVKEL